MAAGGVGSAGAQTAAPAAGTLPPEVEATLARAKLPRESLLSLIHI